jgi:hypothetical protein
MPAHGISSAAQRCARGSAHSSARPGLRQSNKMIWAGVSLDVRAMHEATGWSRACSLLNER